MSEPAPRRERPEAAAGVRSEADAAAPRPDSPEARAYAGRTRYSQLEYEALLANA